MSAGTGHRGLRVGVQVAALVAVFGALAYCLVFRLGGGHWERVETPSMGTTAPVGTLLWIEPVGDDGVEVGEVVSFRKPGVEDGAVYSHRVTEVHEDGTFSTAGDLSGPDVWVVAPDDVVGRVVRTWPGVGWLVAAAPILLLGGLVTTGVVVVVRRSARVPLAVLGASFTVAAVLVVQQPLSNAEWLGVEQGEGTATSRYVSTGLLPIDVTAPGAEVRLSSGEAGAVTVELPESGRVEVDVRAHVPVWFWVALMLLCFSPGLGSVLVGARTVAGGARRREEPVLATA